MGGVLQLAYPVRFPISYLVGLLLCLGLIFVGNRAPQTEVTPRVLEFKAELAEPETPAQVAVAPAIVPQPVPESPARPQRSDPAPVAVPHQHAPASREPLVTPRESVGEPAALSKPAYTPNTTAAVGQSAAVSEAPASVATSPRMTAPATYEASLRAYLERIKRYPTSREARQTRPRGVVKVWLELDRTGRLLDSGLTGSSGSNLLDGEALRTIRSGTYPAFPEGEYQGESRHRFTAELLYHID